MILDICAYRNKVAKMFTNPIFTQEKLENSETNFTRALVINGPEMQVKFKNLAFYHLGKFDDNAGKFELFDEPVLLFDCDDVIASIKAV